MAIRPGYTGVLNIHGKQAVTDPVTTANQNSSYTFTTANTANIGSVSVTKRTAKDPNGNVWVNPGYEASTNSMTFDGTTQSISYQQNSNIHVTPLPFSVQLDFKTDANRTQYIMNLGQGFALGFPEMIIGLGSTHNLYCAYNGANASTPSASHFYANVEVGTWYRVGLMCYNSGGTNYIRGYLNGEVKFQQAMAFLPWVSTAGMALGSDNANYPGFSFQGRIRNFFLGKTLFWPI